MSWRPPASTGGAAITGFVITVVGAHRQLKAGRTARSIVVAKLTKGHAYTFTVAARNARGIGKAATSPAATDGGKVGKKTVVLSKSSLAALSQVETDGTLVFPHPTAQARKLAAAEIVVTGVGGATPGGLLVKVTSVTSAGSQLLVHTRPAALDDALTAGAFGTTATLTSGKVARFIPARSGVRLMTTQSARSAQGSAGFGLSVHTVLYKSGDGRTVIASGSVSVTPNLSFSASVSCCVHVNTKFSATVTASASVSLTAQLSHQISGDFELGEVEFEPLVFDVLGVPVVIVPTLAVDLTAKGSVTAGLVAGASQSLTVGAQVTTSGSKVSASPVYSHTSTWTPPTLFGTLSAAGGVKLDISATVDEIPGPDLVDTIYLLELTVDPSKNPWWELSEENVIELDYDLSLFGDQFSDFRKQLADIVIPLTRAPAPYQDIELSPDPASVLPGGTLQLSAKVAGAAAQNVTWSLPDGNGSITPQGLYTAPSTPGTYQVEADQPANGLKPAAEGLLSIGVGAQPPTAPQAATAASTSVGAATITWKKPADTGGAPITQYTVTAHPGSQSLTVAGSATIATMTGLSPGATFTFTVRASSTGGTSLPSAPTGPVVIDDAGGGSSSGWKVQEAPKAPGAATGPLGINAVACTSATTCVAAGEADGNCDCHVGVLYGKSGGSLTSVLAPLPADALVPQRSTISSIACASASHCFAVGSYASSAADGGGLLLSGWGTSWSAAKAPVPAGSSGAGLSAVACPSATACVAGGEYSDASGHRQGLLLSWSGSAWSATKASLPAGASTDPQVAISAIACHSATACVAVGSYLDSSSRQQALLLTRSGTSWSALKAPLPASGGTTAELTAAACLSATKCATAGFYTDSADRQHALLLTGFGNSWTALNAPVPAGASASPEAFVESIACAGTSACVAVGAYNDSAGHTQGLVLTGPGSTWKAAKAPMPSGAAADPGALLDAVACHGAGACVAVGNYLDGAGDQHGVLLTGADSGSATWKAAKAPLPADVPVSQVLSIAAVACPSSCVAVGASDLKGLVFTGPS